MKLTVVCPSTAGPKFKLARQDRRGWREVVALLRFREDVRNVMPLVAPRIHIHRREEDAERRVKNQAHAAEAPCEIPKRGAKLWVFGYFSPLGSRSARQ